MTTITLTISRVQAKDTGPIEQTLESLALLLRATVGVDAGVETHVKSPLSDSHYQEVDR